MSRIITLVALLASSILLQNCAPTQAFKIREDRPVTLGLVAAMVRPNGNHSLGLSYGANKTSSEEDIKGNKVAGLVSTPSTEATLKETSEGSHIALNYHYYPWQTSAFFIGMGVEGHRNKYTNKLISGTDANQADELVEINNSTSTSVSIPMGWAWIWGNGFTFVLDLGPRLKVSEKFKEEAGPLQDLRNKGNLTIGGGAVLGYSF